MRNASLLLAMVVIMTVGIGCSNSGGPILLDPKSPEVKELGFVVDIQARFNPKTGKVWVVGPAGTSIPNGSVEFDVPGRSTASTRSLSDGSFMYRFPGSKDSTVTVKWIRKGLSGGTEERRFQFRRRAVEYRHL